MNNNHPLIRSNPHALEGLSEPKILDRILMCMKCSLDPEKCGRTNKILKYGNCTERKEDDRKIE